MCAQKLLCNTSQWFLWTLSGLFWRTLRLVKTHRLARRTKRRPTIHSRLQPDDWKRWGPKLLNLQGQVVVRSEREQTLRYIVLAGEKLWSENQCWTELFILRYQQWCLGESFLRPAWVWGRKELVKNLWHLGFPTTQEVSTVVSVRKLQPELGAHPPTTLAMECPVIILLWGAYESSVYVLLRKKNM